MENSTEYNLIQDAEQTAEHRFIERDQFVESTAYQISRALISEEINLSQADHVMEDVGEKYPLSIEEMTTLVEKVYSSYSTGVADDPKERSPEHDASAWAEMLCRLNPKYEIDMDAEGNVNLKLQRRKNE